MIQITITNNQPTLVEISKDTVRAGGPYVLVLINGLSNQKFEAHDLIDEGNGYVFKFNIDFGTEIRNGGQWNAVLYDKEGMTVVSDIANIELQRTDDTDDVETDDIYYEADEVVKFIPGPAGETPYIGENGNWWIGDEDTGVQAQGPQGEQGETGPQGPKGDDGESFPAWFGTLAEYNALPEKDPAVTYYVTDDGHHWFGTQAEYDALPVKYPDTIYFVEGEGSGSGTDEEAVHFTPQTLTASQQAQARQNIGAGTSNFDGEYNSLSNKPGFLSYMEMNTHNSGIRINGETEFGVKQTDISAGITLNIKVDSMQATKLYSDEIITGENSNGRNELAIKGDQNGTVYGKIASSGIYEGNTKLEDKYLQKADAPTKTSDLINDSGFTTFSGDYNDLTNKPTIPAAQVNSDWNASSGVAQILNKPTIPTKTSDLTNDSGFTTFSGDYNDLTNKPTIPAAQIQSDWNQTDNTQKDFIKNKPTLFSGNYNDLTNKPSLSTVATSGDYNDLTNKPTIPAAQVNSDWNASSGVAQILNKPQTEQWIFTVDDGQGGTTTVTKNIYVG